MNAAPSIEAFVAQLKSQVAGDLHSDLLYRQIYSTDASNFQVQPKAVLCPKSIEDVQIAVKACAQHQIPVISRGGGSSLSGQSIGDGLIIDYSKYMNRVLEVNWEEQWVYVQPGIRLQQLNDYLLPKEQMIGPDPSSAIVATIGGMTGNNTTGTHSIVYGMMADQVTEVDIVLANGELLHFEEKNAAELSALLNQNDHEGQIYQTVMELLYNYRQEITENYPNTWRNVAGYNLHRLQDLYQNKGSLNLASLIVGSEGTLGTIVGIKLKTVPKPKATRLALVHFSTLSSACEAVSAILETGPTAVEIGNDYFYELTRQNPEFDAIQREFIIGDPAAVLIVEYSADHPKELDEKIEILYAKLKEIGHEEPVALRKTPEEIAAVWKMRKACFGIIMAKRGDDKPLAFADDATVPIENLAPFIEEMDTMFQEEGIRVVMAGHASAGCIHINPNVNLKTEDGIALMKRIAQTTAKSALKFGGTYTGEHGDGFARSYFNADLYGPKLNQAFREVKTLFDPHNLMQPGKIVDPYEPWTPEILRFQPGYKTPHAPQATQLDFSSDGGFAGLVEMCNGMGFCRKDGPGVMCPSFRATKDERHATRGRANALRAAIKGELPDGLSDKSLYETLDLCLECKACKTECPSMVDMAKLKYEYLYQYQSKHGIPLKSKVFAFIHQINQRSWPFRRLVNYSLRKPIFRKILEYFTDIDQRRPLPLLAKEKFQTWFNQHGTKENAPNGEVILWDDTYLSFNYPEIGKAAVEVLEALGFKVKILQQRACCGRPMVSKGLLKQAKSQAQQNIDLLLPYAQQGIPILGFEPSCIATLIDEYPDLVPGEAARTVAQQSFFFEDFLVEWLEKQQESIPLRQQLTPQSLLLHTHCYQKALGNPDNSLKLLQMIPNCTVEVIQSGCCGMAGSFGYERKHHKISMDIGEETLFPTIREKGNSHQVVAAGISCRHQIKDGTGVRAMHPIELLAACLEK